MSNTYSCGQGDGEVDEREVQELLYREGDIVHMVKHKRRNARANFEVIFISSLSPDLFHSRFGVAYTLIYAGMDNQGLKGTQRLGLDIILSMR